MHRSAAVFLFALTIVLAACGHDGGLSSEEVQRFAAMRLDPDALPASPTNRYADDPEARELGRRLFFDARMSSDGKVSCGSCHHADSGFSDPRPLSLGAFGREGHRHSMPVTALPLHPFLFWDGRADSLWSQPLQAIENPKEMDFGRVEVARFVAAEYRERYEKIFGALPEVGGLPEKGRPGTAAWDAVPEKQRDDVQRVFANVGKAIEAYERRLTCADTRFDRWARGEVQLTAAETAGARAFVDTRCIDCHSGPTFSDGRFHDLGLGSSDDTPDTGREGGVAQLLANPFNGAGAYSDDPAAGQVKLSALGAERVPRDAATGAFRTASLRGAGQRRFFGHLGHAETLEGFIKDVYAAPHLRPGAVGALDPVLQPNVVGTPEDLAAFIHTLDCPPLQPELQPPN